MLCLTWSKPPVIWCTHDGLPSLVAPIHKSLNHAIEVIGELMLERWVEVLNGVGASKARYPGLYTFWVFILLSGSVVFKSESVL